MPQTTFKRVIPVLASLNFEETEAFYRDKLGFKTLSKYPGYLIMGRDDLVLHFWACDSRHIAEHTSCYVIVAQIQALYEVYKSAGVVHPNGDIEDKPHGMREFAILDNNGNMIKFGEPLRD